MLRHHRCRAAFTLIEVMVAVMIVSVVIAALLSMQGSASNSIFEIKKMLNHIQYGSLLLGNSEKYGFENSSIDLLRLSEDFELESELRQKLKAIKTKLEYEVVEQIDTSSMSELSDINLSQNQESTSLVLEIGKTELHSEQFGVSLLRVRLQ